MLIIYSASKTMVKYSVWYMLSVFCGCLVVNKPCFLIINMDDHTQIMCVLAIFCVNFWLFITTEFNFSFNTDPNYRFVLSNGVCLLFSSFSLQMKCLFENILTHVHFSKAFRTINFSRLFLFFVSSELNMSKRPCASGAYK